MELEKTSKQLKQRRGYEVVAILISVFSLGAAVIGVIYQARSEKKRELTCNVLASNELTSVSAVSGLTSRFTYKNKEVAHLWKITMSYANTGNDTLIGQGIHNNLMYDGISLEFPVGTEILSLETMDSDLPVTLELAQAPNAGQNQPTQDNSALNKFKVRFEQWRPGERVRLSVFLASAEPKESPLLPTAPKRDIVDGNVVIKPPLTDTVQTNRSAMDGLPVALSIAVKVLLSLICGFIAILGLFIMPKDAFRYLLVALWKRKHLTEFSEFVNGLELTDEMKKRYISRPDRLPKATWDDYPHQKPRAGIGKSLGFDTATEILTLGSGGFLLGCASAIYVLSNIFDLYHFAVSHLGHSS
jgi:hypothetical protein